MTRFRPIRWAVLIAMIGVGATRLPVVQAQSMSTTASLSGTVSDPSGARVPSATLKLSNPENGITRASTTNSAGEFSFALLPAGTYILDVGAKGFETIRQTGIVLEAGAAFSEDVSLRIGATEQIAVTSTGPLLQTQNSNISTDISSKQIEELPLNLRNVLSFASLDSAVNVQGNRQLLGAGGSEDTADQDYSFLNFGGGYFGNNLFLLNGGYDVAQGWGGVLYVPAPEDTDEVKVSSYSFSAEYGFSTGNAISITTKSGTHDYHFVADEYIRNPHLDANLYFNNLAGLAKPNDHRNQFGFAGGGPLYIPRIYKQRDKTFFFAHYEGLRLNAGLSYSAQVPTQAQLGGDFSAELTSTVLGADCLGRPDLPGPDLQSVLLRYLPERVGGARPLSRKHHSGKRPGGQSMLSRTTLPPATTGRGPRIRAEGSTSTPRRARQPLPTSGDSASTTTSTTIIVFTSNSRISTRGRCRPGPFTGRTTLPGPMYSTRTTGSSASWVILAFSRQPWSCQATCFSFAIPGETWSRATRSSLPHSVCRANSIRGPRSFHRLGLGTPSAVPGSMLR